MSTRAVVKFSHGRTNVAMVYRHGDGYVEGLGQSILEFLYSCKNLSDSRLCDASYLAAKWVVYDSQEYGQRDGTYKQGDYTLNFLSVGIVSREPGDIEFRYTIDCNKLNQHGLPPVKVEKRFYGEDRDADSWGTPDGEGDLYKILKVWSSESQRVLAGQKV